MLVCRPSPLLYHTPLPRKLTPRASPRYFYQTEHLEQVKGFGRLLDMMSPRLRGEIAFLSNQEWIMKVWYFQNCSDEFVSELSLCMEAMMFAPKELLDMPATIYIVCNKGIVFRKAQILSQGAVWGLDCILNDLTLMDASVALAMSFVEVAYITRESLTRLIEEYPEEQKRMRKARVKIAILRGLVQVRAVAAAAAAAAARLLYYTAGLVLLLLSSHLTPPLSFSRRRPARSATA
jgi:hypothetical protein